MWIVSVPFGVPMTYRLFSIRLDDPRLIEAADRRDMVATAGNNTIHTCRHQALSTWRLKPAWRVVLFCAGVGGLTLA
jgi:hypothetical protein